MAHMLKKDKKVTFKPGHPGVPAFAGQPWMPARTVTVQTQECKYVPVATVSPLAGG